MNPILYLIYQFLKLLVKTCYRIFFSKSTVINEERFNISKPCILVSNHPSTMIDPLNVAKYVPATVFFLANASLFKHPITDWLLNKLYCIPIERPKDVDGRKISNEDNFRRADEFLKKGGVLYIAPEGTSVMEKALRRVKTGTARIALSAESKNNFQLGLTILPVGLTYSSPTEFRSKTLLNVGEPLKVADYAALHRKDPIMAVKSLTADLQDRMGNLIYNIRDDEEAFIDKVETLLNNETPLSEEKQYFRSKDMIGNLRKLKSGNSADFNDLKKRIEEYFSLLKQNKINELSLLNANRNKSGFTDLIKLILGFPFFAYGWINNILACIFPAWLAKKLKLYIGYKSTVKVLTGIFTFPIFFGLQISLVNHFFENSLVTWTYALSLLPMGWLAWEYLEFAKQYFKNTRAGKISEIDKLSALRNGLTESIKSIYTSATISPKT